MTAVRTTLCAALLLAAAAVAQDPAPAPVAPPQEQPAGQPAGQSAEQPAGQPKLVPAAEVMAGTSIPDIQAHRGRPLSVVRHAADVVQLGLPPVDPDAAVVLEVDGRPVPRSEFRRRALMLAAVNETERYVTKILTDMEIERARAAGETRDFAVSDAEVDARFEDMKNMIRANARGQMVPDANVAPSSDPNDPAERAVAEYVDSIESSIGMDEYRKLLAGDSLFEKAYLPFPAEKVAGEAWDFTKGPPPLDEPRPAWMPEATWTAMGRSEQGRNLRSFIKQWSINGEPIPAMFKPSILGMIRDGLVAGTGVTMFFDQDLPEGVFMLVGDRVVSTEELWPMVAGRLSDVDVELIVRELLTLEGMRKGLQAAGAWMDDAKFKESWAAHEGQYANSFIPLKTIIQLRGYTSVERYREHFRYREAFVQWKKGVLTDEEVLEHYQGGGRLFFERGNIVVDLAFLPLGSRPFNDASFDELERELGAAMAEARAAAGEGEDWFARVVEKFPGPAARPPSDGHTFQRNQLGMQVAESELSLLLTGYSKVHEAYYLAGNGEVVGPWSERCRHHAWGAEQNAGAWAVRVRDFTRRNPLPAFDGRNRDMAYEDWCDLHFFHFAQESLKALLPKARVPAQG